MPNCPQCQFAGVNFLPDGRLKCAACGQLYQARLAYPQQPRGVAHSPSRAIPLVVGASAVGLILFAGLFVFMFSVSRDSSPPVQSTQSEPSPASQTPQAETVLSEPEVLDAQIGETILHGVNGTIPWWLVSYRNKGNVPIAGPRVTASFTDADGNHLKDAEYAAYVIFVPPGETVYVFLSAGNVKEARAAEFKAVPPKGAGRYTSMYRRLEVDAVAIEPQAGAMSAYPFLTGTIHNQYASRVFVAVVQAIGYDEEGRPCEYALGRAKESNLDPGEESTFKILTGVYRTGTAVRWEVHAWGPTRK